MDDKLHQQEEKIQRILERIKALPTLSVVVARVIQVVSNPLTSASDLSSIIMVDQALTAKVLRLANSAFYGFPFRIKNITQAVSILGFDTIRNLALTVSVHKIFTGDDRNAFFSHQEFWKHSVGVALCCSLLAKKIKYKSHESAFTAGLLHDIGKTFFEQYMHEEFVAALKDSAEKKIPLYQAEMQIIGIDHQAVGRIMAEKWNLPHELQAGINFHHHPEDEQEENVMATIVNVANSLCNKKGLGNSGDTAILPLSGEARALLNLDEKAEDELMAKLDLELNEAQAFFNMTSF